MLLTDVERVREPAADPIGETAARPDPAATDRGSIDLLRGVVCLGVVIMHDHSAFPGPMGGPTAGRAVEFGLAYLRPGVESFFVLGGYFLAHTFRPSEARFLSIPRHALRRILRLAVPYWVVVASLFLAAWAANVVAGRSNPLPGAWQVAAALFFVQDIFVDKYFPFFTLWSMAPLFQSYVAWALAYWTIRRLALRAAPESYQAITPRVMAGLAYVCCLASIGFTIMVPDAGWQLPGWAWAFALGALTYWRTRREVGRLPFAATLLIVLAGSMLAGGLAVIAAKAVACSLLLLGLGRGYRAPDGPVARALGFVGQRSYSIYLVHGPVGFRLIGWMAAASPPRTQAMILAQFSATLAAGVAAGFVFYRLVEQPSARLSARVEYRR
ncbi:acyltransferase family protein (plasmid) [Tundrisphaera sp. TA3]|uniref:acyltransferase family protein n=1 Tax=Tundrisphaera sp. TA3 TaxID=3435775 RepID=UPI003EB72D74